MSGRQLNVLLGQDPDDTNFMDPDNQHFFCYTIKNKADEIHGGDARLRKAKPPSECRCQQAQSMC